MYQAFEHLCEKLKIEGKDIGRVLIFCKKYTEVTALYFFFKHTLKECFTYPASSPDYIQNRLVDMYTSCTHASVKAKIVERFTKPSSLHVVIGTIAFGMGINCPDIREVIHWGVSDDVEMYIQETGRAGRDSHHSHCILMYEKRDLHERTTSKAMINYCTNTGNNICRRVLLFSQFEEYDLLVVDASAVMSVN